MLGYITHEKVEEVIRLAEQAGRSPRGQADDPHRRGVRPVTETGARQPLEPQPEPDWAHAVRRYLADLSDEAVAELVSLYRCADGAYGKVEEAFGEWQADPEPHEALVAYLCSKPDLPDRLRRAIAG